MGRWGIYTNRIRRFGLFRCFADVVTAPLYTSDQMDAGIMIKNASTRWLVRKMEIDTFRVAYEKAGEGGDVVECRSCNQSLSFDYFHEDLSRPSGRSAVCRVCRSQRDRSLDLLRQAQKRNPVSCRECGEHRKLVGDGVCRKCLRHQGLRWCPRCREIKTQFLDFYDGQSICIECRSAPKVPETDD